MIIVGPDGVENEFPDGTPEEQILAAMQAQYGGPRSRPKQNRALSAGLMAADGVSFGFSDEATGLAAAATGFLPQRIGKNIGKSLLAGEGFAGIKRAFAGEMDQFGATRRRVTDGVKDLQEQAKEDNPVTSTVAGIGGALLPAFFTGGTSLAARAGITGIRGVQPAMNIAARAGRLVPGFLRPAATGAASGAVYGGLYGAGSAEDGERLDGAKGGALMGAAGGAIIGSALPLLARPVGNAAEAVLNRVRAMRGKPANPTLGEALGEGAAQLGARADEAIGEVGTRTAKEARALGERFGVRLTTGQQMRAGQRAGTPAAERQQYFERDAASGAMGEPAQNVMRPFFSAQGEQLAQAARRIVDPTADALTPVGAKIEDASDRLRAALMRADDDMVRARDEAYGVFRTTQAKVAPEDLQTLPELVRSRVRGEGLPPEAPAWDPELPSFTPSAAGNAIRVLENDIASLAERGGATPAQIEQMRRQVIAIGERLRPEQREEMAGLMRVRDALDEWFGGQMARGISGGTADEMAAMQAARGEHARYADLLRSPAAPVLRDLVNDGSKEISGVQLLNAVLGAGDRGLSAGPRTIGQLDRVIKALGNGDEAAGRATPEFQALREAATDRIFRPLLEQVAAGKSPPIAATIKLLDDALMIKGREIAQKLYTPQELAAMREFRRLLALVEPIEGTAKSSGTAERLARLAGTAAQVIPGLNPLWNAVLGQAMRGAGSSMAAGRASRAIAGRGADLSLLQRAFQESAMSRQIEAGAIRPLNWATTNAPAPEMDAAYQ